MGKIIPIELDEADRKKNQPGYSRSPVDFFNNPDTICPAEKAYCNRRERAIQGGFLAYQQRKKWAQQKIVPEWWNWYTHKT